MRGSSRMRLPIKVADCPTKKVQSTFASFALTTTEAAPHFALSVKKQEMSSSLQDGKRPKRRIPAPTFSKMTSALMALPVTGQYTFANRQPASRGAHPHGKGSISAPHQGG